MVNTAASQARRNFITCLAFMTGQLNRDRTLYQACASMGTTFSR